MMLTDAAGGLALALSFAQLWQRRRGGMMVVVALLGMLAALAAVSHGAWGLAVLELGCAGFGLPLLLSREPAALWPARAGVLTAAAAALSLIALPIADAGPGLAVVLLGGLLTVARPDTATRVAGMAGMQSGIVLAGLGAGAGPLLLAAPLLPALVLAGARLRGRRFGRRPMHPAVDFAGCVVLFLLCCALPWYRGVTLPGLRLDTLGVAAAILVTLLAAALRWPPDRSGAPFALRGVMLAIGAVIAVLASDGTLAWTGLAIATLAAAVTGGSRPQNLAAVGFGLTLFGQAMLPAIPLPGSAALLVGYGCLATLSPEMAGLTALLLLRLPGLVPAALAGLDPLLIVAGLLALGVAAAGLAASPGPATATRHRRLPGLATIGQAGIAVFALGLHTPAGDFAAVLQIVLLVLTRLALELAPEPGLPRLASLAGLAGLPPFGLFPSLTLILVATADRAPLLLLPLGAGLAAFGWSLVRTVPDAAGPVRPTLAWVPLAALLLLGFAMPGPVAAGLHLIAEGLR